jgi:hypothetical protein
MMGSFNTKTASNSKKLTIIAVLIFVIVILNAVILYLYLKKDQNSDPQRDGQLRNSAGVVINSDGSVALDTVNGQNPGNGKTESNNYPPQTAENIPGKYPQASFREITYSDIKGMHVWDIIVMRNEIYARYGHIFTKSWELRDYFNAQSWYQPLSTNVENQLTDLEKRNVRFLLEHTPQFDMNNIRGSNTYVR